MSSISVKHDNNQFLTLASTIVLFLLHIYMKIIVDDTSSIYAIQEAFHQIFPYLKLEFYRKNSQNQHNQGKLSVDSDKAFAHFRAMQNAENIVIDSEMTVSELEKKFYTIYGLFTQVMRKSGNIWLGTTITDNWSLEEQNKQGEMLTSQITGTSNFKS